MRKAGVAESVIMQMTGHNTREMFDRYNTIDADDTKDAVAMFEGYLNRNGSASVTQTLPKKQKRVRCYHLTL